MSIHVENHNVKTVGENTNSSKNNLWSMLFVLLADAKRLSNDGLQIAYQRTLSGTNALEKSAKELESIPLGSVPSDIEQSLQAPSTSPEQVAKVSALLTSIQIQQTKANAFREGVSNDMMALKMEQSLDSTGMNTETTRSTQTTESAVQTFKTPAELAEKLYR